MKNVEECAKKIVATLYADSHVSLKLQDVVDALKSDGHVMSDTQIAEFIMGDEEGAVPVHLRVKFRNLNALVNNHF